MRSPRFRLRTLLVIVAVAGLLLGLAAGIARMAPAERAWLLLFLGPFLALVGARILVRIAFASARSRRGGEPRSGGADPPP